MPLTDELQDLATQARVARRKAYAPYSGYEVGAAVREEDGRVFTGCNMENASYGLTMCAERVAISAMVSAGGRRIAQIAVVTRDGAPPCGMCLQTMIEFADEPEAVEIALLDENGSANVKTLDELMPCRFDSNSLQLE